MHHGTRHRFHQVVVLVENGFIAPTITDSVPSIAFGSPPLTGASNISTPFAFSASLISRLASGAIELISINTVRLRAFDDTVLAQRNLFHMRRVRQHRDDDVTLFSDRLRRRGRFAPAAMTSAIASGLRSDTTSEYPAFSKFLLMGLPMMPKPIKPTFIVIAFSFHTRLFFKGVGKLSACWRGMRLNRCQRRQRSRPIPDNGGHPPLPAPECRTVYRAL